VEGQGLCGGRLGSPVWGGAGKHFIAWSLLCSGVVVVFVGLVGAGAGMLCG
jgi:hypothetical protein